MNTRNNHVNRERKTNYIFNMIWNNTDIKHDTCCSNNLFQICWQHKTGLLSCSMCTVRTALFTPVGSSALNSAVRTGLNNTVDNNVHRVQHNTVHACSEQYCSGLLTTCSMLCVFTRVPQYQIDKLQRVQNAAARLVTRTRKFDSIYLLSWSSFIGYLSSNASLIKYFFWLLKPYML